MSGFQNMAQSSSLRLTIIIFSMVTLLLCTTDSHARRKDETKAKGAIDAKTFEVLMEAQELTQSDQYDAAIRKLDSIKNSDKLNSYAKSQMWNFYAYIYASQEQFNKAIDAYKRLIAEPDAPGGLKLTAKYTVAQLYFQVEDYPSVISFMEEWLREIDKPTATAHIMLAQAYYQSKKYDPALNNLIKAMDIEKAEGKKINENWLRLKAAIYFEKQDIKNTLNTYKELLSYYPKTVYLRQIAGLYGELGNERKRLTTYDALYLHGALDDESEILNLAYMYLGQEVPYKAGKIIEAGMDQNKIKKNTKNVETLANAWAQANEHKKAIPTLEQAASLSDKGIIYARLAGVYFDAGDFEKAAIAAKKADEKGGLKRKDNNLMLMGMAMFNTKDFEGALQAFRRAKSSKQSFSDARKWESYTLSELERLKAIKESEFELAKTTKETLEADESNVEAIGKRMLDDIEDDDNDEDEIDKIDDDIEQDD